MQLIDHSFSGTSYEIVAVLMGSNAFVMGSQLG
uniref:Uncharacterized protein n=1 Tax=Arundo donax TaxID=35708 RepID=A0A0A9A458_ARUDO